MLTALAVDDRAPLRRLALARRSQDTRRADSAHHPVEEFAELVHAAEAAARRAAMAG